MVNPSDNPVARLARRLKALRLDGLAGQKITQRQLGAALNASAPLISSWENVANPKIPPAGRLEAYARFFASDRSVVGHKYRILASSELTDQERAKKEELLHNLTALRREAQGSRQTLSKPGSSHLGGLWEFPAGQDVTIICAELPTKHKLMPYADPKNPDYVRGYRFADLDALVELYGHLRAVNPATTVRFRTTEELVPEDYTAHLVVLGGVDWNPVTAELMDKISSPVRQKERTSDEDSSGFTISGHDFEPEVVVDRNIRTLKSDVAHFYHGISPFNKERTVTICNGMFGLGVLGAVRALTDVRMRNRNEAYVRERFADAPEFSILSRVMIVNGEAVPPDWTSSSVRLHEWHDVPS